MYRKLIGSFIILAALVATVQCDEDCHYAPEIVLVQDVTTSYESVMDTLRKNMPQVFDMLHTYFPGTKFGITSFRDAYPCGYMEDYCIRLEQSLTSPGATDMAKSQAVFANLAAGGGGDLPEDFLGAIIRTALSPDMGWSPPNVTHNEEGLPIIRILIATTDCVISLPGGMSDCSRDLVKDELKKRGPVPTSFPYQKYTEKMPINDGEWLRGDINAKCGAYDYPSVEDAVQVLHDRDIIPVLLFGRGTSPGTRHTPNETFGYKSYHDFAKLFGYSDQKKYPQFWTDFAESLTKLMRTVFHTKFHWDPLIDTVDDQMEAFTDRLHSMMTKAVELKCLRPSTTPEPSTEPVSTSKPIVTTAKPTAKPTLKPTVPTTKSTVKPTGKPTVPPHTDFPTTEPCTDTETETEPLSTVIPPTVRPPTDVPRPTKVPTVIPSTPTVSVPVPPTIRPSKPTKAPTRFPTIITSTSTAGGSTEETEEPTKAPIPPVPTSKPATGSTRIPTGASSLTERPHPRTESTSSGDSGDTTSTTIPPPSSETTGTTSPAGGGMSTGVIIGSASGGVAALGAAIGGGIKAYSFFKKPSIPDAPSPGDAEVPDSQLEREAYEEVTADLFM